jgi:single-strand DNA-binding protein
VTAVLDSSADADGTGRAAHSPPGVSARAAGPAVSGLSGGVGRAAAVDRGRAHRNEVTVVGRLSGPVRQRRLHSGGVSCAFRVVVRRGRATGRVSVDVLDCVARQMPVRRAVCRWSAGDLVEVRGAVRRRCRLGVSGGVVSRCEIEVDVARRLAAAAALARRHPAAGPTPGGIATAAARAARAAVACVPGGGTAPPPPAKTGPVTRRPPGQLAPPGGSPTAVSPAPELSGCPTGRGRKEVLTQV